MLELHPHDVPSVERFDERDLLPAFAEWRGTVTADDPGQQAPVSARTPADEPADGPSGRPACSARQRGVASAIRQTMGEQL